jgi:hypothetical protein
MGSNAEFPPEFVEESMTESFHPLQGHETDLVGSWIVQDGKMAADATCRRIEWLIANRLTKVGNSLAGRGWESAYEDPSDNRLWERTYPESGTHGSGPPRLRALTIDDYQRRYGDR